MSYDPNSDLHYFTPTELRARDEAIIRATCNNIGSIFDDEYPMRKDRIDDIIAAWHQNLASEAAFVGSELGELVDLAHDMYASFATYLHTQNNPE